jgi:nucleoside-diphosphate-sugar epimerase|tara:strand:+ start:1798 stop:2817 length:1020 start_codon:yes stop_codon:yes gene_type:complete
MTLSIAGMKVLVTGAGGFLGSTISKQLLREDCEVTGFSRGSYPALAAAGVEMKQGDIRDYGRLATVAASHDAIVHTAAVAGVWGPRKLFHSINVDGTTNVIQACRELGISKLVFTSSPSVTFDGEHQRNLGECADYPTKWLAHYPHTKALAEQAVLDANSSDLATVALRPHLIWGPGDPHLIPRVLDRGSRNRLRIIGEGSNQVDMVYVDNAAQAHLCALKSLEIGSLISGKSYWVTQQQPVKLWDWINEILTLAGIRNVKSKVSAKLAYRIGGKLEFVYKVLRIQSEPPMTRFVAKQLSTDHYFDNSAARDELGFKPQISTQDGMLRLAEWIRNTKAD